MEQHVYSGGAGNYVLPMVVQTLDSRVLGLTSFTTFSGRLLAVKDYRSMLYMLSISSANSLLQPRFMNWTW